MNRKKIADIVRALRAKTVENGCTEGEAAAAAKKIAQLLEQYNMTLDEAELRESDFTKANHPQDDLIGKVIYRVASAISHMMDIKFWSERPGEPRSTTFFGFTHEVEIAGYLLDICRSAMKTQSAKIEHECRLLRESVRRRRVSAFLDGMADRLAQRIKELKPAKPTGTGLVVLRKELVEAALKDEGIELQGARGSKSNTFDEEYQRGRKAADKVGLNPGVESSQRPRGQLT